MKRHEQAPWFIKVRGSYLPSSWRGWLTYLPFIAFLVWSFFVLERYFVQAAVTAVLYIPVAVAATVIMTWIAARKS